MAIMTLNDRLVLISSHLDSIKRAVKRGDYSSTSTFLGAIAEVAAEGSEETKVMAGEEGAPKLEPSP